MQLISLKNINKQQEKIIDGTIEKRENHKLPLANE